MTEYPFNFDQYRELIEESRLPWVQAHMEAERQVLTGVFDIGNRTLVDLGAGYGRMWEAYRSAGYRDIIHIELNPNMLPELHRRSELMPNSRVIEGDMRNIATLLKDVSMHNPVFMMWQNTLGTLEGEGKVELLTSIVDFIRKVEGDLILSLFCAEGLKDYGKDFYASLADMIGPIDEVRSNLSEGVFVSKTGYISYWQTPKSREFIDDILVGGLHIQHLTHPEYPFEINHKEILPEGYDLGMRLGGEFAQLVRRYNSRNEHVPAEPTPLL